MFSAETPQAIQTAARKQEHPKFLPAFERRIALSEDALNDNAKRVLIWAARICTENDIDFYLQLDPSLMQEVTKSILAMNDFDNETVLSLFSAKYGIPVYFETDIMDYKKFTESHTIRIWITREPCHKKPDTLPVISMNSAVIRTIDLEKSANIPDAEGDPIEEHIPA